MNTKPRTLPDFFFEHEEFIAQLDTRHSAGQAPGLVSILGNATQDELLCALFWAAFKGHVEAVKLLVTSYHQAPDAKDGEGVNLLQFAAWGGHPDAVLPLKNAYGLSPKAKNYDGAGLLHFAAYGGHAETVIKLKNIFGLSPKVKDKDGASLLHYAAFGGNAEVVKTLATTYKLSPKAVDKDGQSLLHDAARAGFADTIIELQNTYKLDPNARDNRGWSILHFAARNGHDHAFSRLAITYGIDKVTLVDILGRVNLPPKTSSLISQALNFYEALNNNALKRLRNLFNSIAPKTKKNFMQWPLFDGAPPLHQACIKNKYELATLLIEHGSPYEGYDDLLQDNVQALSCYHLALARNALPGGDLHVLSNPNLVEQMAMRAQAKKDTYYVKDMNILMNALIGGHLQAGKAGGIALNNIAKGSAETYEAIKRTQQTILLYAIESGNSEIAERYAEILAGLGKGLRGIYRDTVSHNTSLAFELLFKVLESSKQLKLEMDALREGKEVVKPFLPSQSNSKQATPLEPRKSARLELKRLAKAGA